MIGNPKYKYNDKVRFELNGSIREGFVYIIDPYGTFEQNEEPSYDIFIEGYEDICNGQKVLVKHVRESHILD